MAPFRNSEVVPLSEVPTDELTKNTERHENRKAEAPIVLVVDDEPLVADTLAAILSHSGYITITAYSGAKALELVSSIHPALIISDVAMPKMTGVELALAVVKSSPECGVVLFSGHATARDLAPAYEAGYDFTLLAKPVHPAEMLKHVSRNLHGVRHKKSQIHLTSTISTDILAESA
jgi:DNA-binding NtrC family response regulator